MQIVPTDLAGVQILIPRRFGDERGWFTESYNAGRLAQEAGISTVFIQDNLSFSARPGTVRGLHFQCPPAAQAKLVSVIVGAVFDVVVDIRHGSPTFGRYAAVRLTAQEGNQLYIPEGFAHGYCTLEPGTVFAYKVSAAYTPAADAGIFWDDPALAIPWPEQARQGAVVSDKDARLPRLAAMAPVFRYSPA